MSTPSRRLPAKSAQRTYASVEDLIKGEGLGDKVQQAYAQLVQDTCVTDGLTRLRRRSKLTQAEIAQRLGKSCRVLPAGLIQTALWVLKKLKLTQYGPEQLDFLRYRPVLLNTRLKEEFGYVPKLTSAQVFDLYRTSRQTAK